MKSIQHADSLVQFYVDEASQGRFHSNRYNSTFIHLLLTIAMTDTEPTDTPPFDAARLAKAVRQRLQSLQRSVSSIQTQTGQSVVYINCKINSLHSHGLPIGESEFLNPP